MVHSSTGGVVDVHSHYMSAPHLGALLAGHRPKGDGIKFPRFSVAETLEVMDETGMEMSVLTPLSPPPTLDAAELQAVCRSTNDDLAGMVADYPRRLGAAGFLPMPYVRETLAEVAYVLDELRLDGIHLFTSFDGHYLGDAIFEPLLAELDARRSTVILHPSTPAGSDIVSMGWPGPTLEFVFDSTRTVASLLYSGALARHPQISWIVPHGGGTLLATWERLVRSVPILRAQPEQQFPDMPVTPDQCRTLLRTLYFDVTWNTHSPVLRGLAELVGEDHLLFGTDRPFPVPVAADLALLDSSPDISAPGKQLIRRDNALRLFPTVAARMATFADSAAPATSVAALPADRTHAAPGRVAGR